MCLATLSAPLLPSPDTLRATPGSLSPQSVSTAFELAILFTWDSSCLPDSLVSPASYFLIQCLNEYHIQVDQNPSRYRKVCTEKLPPTAVLQPPTPLHWHTQWSVCRSPFRDSLYKCKQILKTIIHLLPFTQMVPYSIHLYSLTLAWRSSISVKSISLFIVYSCIVFHCVDAPSLIYPVSY